MTDRPGHRELPNRQPPRLVDRPPAPPDRGRPTTILQSILDLHQPGVRGIDVGFDYCEECRKIYPCQTVRLVTANLRGGVDD